MSPLKLDQPGNLAPIYKMVLTGGPCAGKTTALARLSAFFRDRGFRVYLVPEACTMLSLGGVSPFELHDREHVLNFQWQILNMQMTLEDSFASLARDTGKPCLVLCDRGAMDGSAYVDEELWDDLKSRHDLNTVELRDTRYIAVFHLITSAQGAESFYTLSNNDARTEDIASACAIDRKTLDAWVGHPRLYVFDNSTDFEGKMQRLVNTASSMCGLPSTVKASRKFRLTRAPTQAELPLHHEDFEVEKVYLQPVESEQSSDYSFVRCRSQYGLPAYGMTTVREIDSGETKSQVDLKRVITAREYAYAVRHRADSTRAVIKQKRICFLWKDQSFQIHVYKEPPSVAGLAIVHIQASVEHSDSLEFPPFLELAEELKQERDTEYSAYKVSLLH